MDNRTSNLIHLLLSRLERVTADSYWAHRASGIRGVLLKTQQSLEDGKTVNASQVERQLKAGFDILEHAGKEKISRSGPKRS